jgi:hypothetical protein
MIFSNRYNLGRQCNLNKWERWNQHITKLLESKFPVHFLVASNEFDASYVNYYTGLTPTVIEPTGFLYGALEGRYNYTESVRPEILLGPSQGVFIPSEEYLLLLSVAKTNGFDFKHPNKVRRLGSTLIVICPTLFFLSCMEDIN